MANMKPAADKSGGKSVAKPAKAEKKSPKTPASSSNKIGGDKQKKKTETIIKKPAVKASAASPASKATGTASKKGVKADSQKLEKHSIESASGKTIKKPTAPVKEKTSKKLSTPETQEAPEKKKAASKPATKKSTPAKPIKIPKISATAAVPYEPDFTHSVLDRPKSDPVEANTVTMRYSDGDLMEFRNLIHRKLDAAKKELTYLQGLITRKDEMGGDNDDGRYMTMEDGSLSMEREQLSQMASRQITFIDHLEKALMRIENKTYGVCRVTGRLIEKARLRAVPHATLSMEAKSSNTRVG